MTDTVSRDEFESFRDSISGDVEKIIELVTGLLDSAGEQGAPAQGAGRRQWTNLHGDDRTALWYELRDFINWYNDRLGHASSQLAIWPCWPRHPIVIEEMTAQMVAWKAAHKPADPTDAIRLWFEHLWPAIRRIHDGDGEAGGLSRCSARSHQGAANAVEPGRIEAAVFDAFVREDVEANTPAEDTA